MGYELKGDELNTLVCVSSRVIGEWLSALEEIRLQMKRVINSNAWGGQSGENIRSYLQEVHVEGLLPMLSDLLYDYVAKLSLYDYGYSQIDSDIHKKLSEDAIREAQERYRPEPLEECRTAFGEVLSSISGLLETANPSIRDIENDCGRIHYRLEHLMHEISEQEERAKSEWTGPLSALADALSQAVRAALSRPSGGVTGYNPGDAWNIRGMQEAYMRCVSAESGWRAERGLIEKSAAYESGVAEKLREEYEAQQAEEKKKHREDTFGAMLGSGLMVLAGAAAVVGSAGTATPLVASCFLGASGSTVMAFGLSDAMESTAEYATGEEACNPLRELAFGGNEEVYRSVETAAVLTAGFAGSAGSWVSAEGVITKSGLGRIAVGEAAGIVASVGIEEAGSRMGLTDTERLLLNLGAGMAIGKLTERIPAGQKADGGSQSVGGLAQEEDFKKNAAVAREDLDVRTKNVIEENRGWGNEGGKGSKFKYEHNPSDNPKVLQDAVEDSNAVYGYRPSKTGSVKAFADDDWSDINLVNSYRENRIKYHQENDINIEIVNSMRSEGKTDSEIARALVERRNSNRLASYIDDNGKIIDINKYNQALEHCKTYDELKKGNVVKAGKTDLEIIESSTKGNSGFDACTGLYDIYFKTYKVKE